MLKKWMNWVWRMSQKIFVIMGVQFVRVCVLSIPRCRSLLRLLSVEEKKGASLGSNYVVQPWWVKLIGNYIGSFADIQQLRAESSFFWICASWSRDILSCSKRKVFSSRVARRVFIWRELYWKASPADAKINPYRLTSIRATSVHLH